MTALINRLLRAEEPSSFVNNLSNPAIAQMEKLNERCDKMT